MRPRQATVGALTVGRPIGSDLSPTAAPPVQSALEPQLGADQHHRNVLCAAGKGLHDARHHAE